MAAHARPQQQQQHGKAPRVQGLTSKTGLTTTKPLAALLGGQGPPPLALQPSAATAAAGSRGPMRGKGRQQQRRRAEDSDGDYEPEAGAGSDDSLLGHGRKRPATRRAKKQQATVSGRRGCAAGCGGLGVPLLFNGSRPYARMLAAAAVCHATPRQLPPSL